MKSIKLFNESFKVVLATNEKMKELEDIDNDSHYCGLINKATSVIYINSELSENQKHKTLFHELLHAYFWHKTGILHEIKEDYDREEFITKFIEVNIEEFIKLKNISDNYNFKGEK